MDSTFSTLRSDINSYLQQLVPQEPKSLYAPVAGIVRAGGKRVRPILTGLAARLTNDSNHWLSAAAAVELLHTFTLVHDDIMDNATTRRGRATTHITHGMSTAILAGDVLIALAIETLGKSLAPRLGEMISEFALGFRLVCDGQALDKEFETRDDITVSEYLHMIDLKTSKVVELAAVLGALAGDGSHVEELRKFAHHAGLAFQITDDLLDLTGDEASFGKSIGGDILEGKRTYLFVSAMEQFSSLGAADSQLMTRIRDRQATPDDIPAARALFERIGVLRQAAEAAEAETREAQDALRQLPDSSGRRDLETFSENLLGRTF